MSTREKRNTATRTAILVVFGLAVVVGASSLLGIRKQNTLLLGSHPREAFAAVKRAAGPRMQVRRIDVSTNEMSVLAWDADMPDQRWLSNNQRRSGPGHWYSGQGVKEQRWRVAYWTIFGRDWYRVTGPIVEGIIQEQEGP